jgi:hypothetical protein
MAWAAHAHWLLGHDDDALSACREATWPVLAAGLILAAAFVAHIRRHPDPLVEPRLFSARAFSAGAAGLVAYYMGFAAMLLGTTLLLGSALGVAIFVAVLGAHPASSLAGFDRAWTVVLITAAMTAFAGLVTGPRLIRVPAVAAKAQTAGDALQARSHRQQTAASAAADRRCTRFQPGCGRRPGDPVTAPIRRLCELVPAQAPLRSVTST